MAWLFGSGKRAPSGQPESKVAREKQIANLKERVPGLEQKSADSSLFEVRINAPPNGALVMLRVFLPTKFPSERPVLQLLSQVSHPWVNQYMQVVGHPDLVGWDATAPPMIGGIVAAVIVEFRRGNAVGGEMPTGRHETSSWGGQSAQQAGFSREAPIMGQSGHSQYARSDASPVMGASNIRQNPVNSLGRAGNEGVVDTSNPAHSRGRDSRANKSRRQPKEQTPIPGIPTKFDELQDMTTAQLSRLLDDDVARQALLQGMPSVVGMKELRTEVRKGNVKTAQATLAKQDEARVLREEAERLQLTLKELQTSYEGTASTSTSAPGQISSYSGKAQGRDKNLGGTADQVILKQVKHASKLADSSSERVANAFLEKRLPLQDFLDDFMRERQRYHMLAAKIECMKRDIRF